ncbi:MAG: GAF domain-containing protein [Candidatus Rokubacteria bacterium]|nr:GAF domain-containing protein [Candidatus Rokubacteria bacterium]
MDHPQQEPPDKSLWDSLAEIGRTLESLRQRLQQLEPEVLRKAVTPETPPGAPREGVGEPLAEPLQTALAHFQEIAAIPSTGLDANEAFGLAIDRITRLLIVDRAVLFLLDADRGRLYPRASRGFRRDDLLEVSLLPGEGLVGEAFRGGRPLVYATPVGGTPSDPFIFRFPVRDAIALPIRAESEVLGVLYAGRRGRPASFTVDEVQLLTFIADRIGTALVHRRLVDKIAGQVDRLRELVRVSARTSLRYDIAEILSSTCEAGCRLLRVRGAAIAIARPDGELRPGGSYGFPEGVLEQWRPRASEGLTAELFASHQPVVCPDLLARPGPEDPFLVALGLRSALLVPLRIREELIGCLYLGERAVKEFSADEVEAAQLLAGLAAIAVENGRLFSEVRQGHEALKATQEQLVQSEKMRALGEMAAGIAHEFNNILAIIVGKTQLMQERTHETPLREDLGVIQEAAWRAADIVRRLQGFAVTQTAEKLSSLDLNRLIEDAVSLTRPRWKDEAEARGIRVEVVTDLEETAPVHGNPAELREMMTNLILNALDAMPNGGRLALRTRKRQDAVELSVTDTGAGMTESVRRRAFEPFFTTRSPQRAGLGLSVVHGIVVRHKGSIEIESQEGRGTTVRIGLPTALPVGAAPAPTAAPAMELAPGSAAILVIEDEDHIRRMLVDILAGAGHSVEAARDGLEGLARFQRGTFDLVMTDLSMPEYSGLEVAQAVKKMNPVTPVVLITGWGDLLDPARVQQAGVDLMLVKPFRVERVLNVVAEALRLRRLAGP